MLLLDVRLHFNRERQSVFVRWHAQIGADVDAVLSADAADVVVANEEDAGYSFGLVVFPLFFLFSFKLAIIYSQLLLLFIVCVCVCMLAPPPLNDKSQLQMTNNKDDDDDDDDVGGGDDDRPA